MTRRQSVSLGLVFLVLGMLASTLLGNARFLNEAGERARLDELVSGEAARPFVLRRMVPVTVGVIERIVPDGVEGKIRQALVAFDENGFAVQPFQRTMHPEELPEQGHLYLYLLIVQGVFLGVFGFFLARLVSLLFETSASNGVWVSVSALGAYPFFSPFVSHFGYDQATLAMMAMGMYGSLSGSRKWFWAALVLAPWNRVTAVFLPVIDVVWNWNASEKVKPLGIAAGQVVYCLAVTKFIEWSFAENPGQNIARKWGQNLEYLGSFSEPTYFPFWFCVLFIGWFHWRAWGSLPEKLKRVIPWVYGPVLVLHLFFGVLREFRAFVELYPFFWLVGAGLVFGYLKKLDSPINEAS